MGLKSNHKAIGYPRNSHAIIVPMAMHSLGVSRVAQLATVAGPLLHFPHSYIHALSMLARGRKFPVQSCLDFFGSYKDCVWHF